MRECLCGLNEHANGQGAQSLRCRINDVRLATAPVGDCRLSPPFVHTQGQEKARQEARREREGEQSFNAGYSSFPRV